MLSDSMLADLRQQQVDDPALQALLIVFDAMRHDLETTEGLYAIDRELPDQPDMFRLEFPSIRLSRKIEGSE